ncbi:hypothetical protein N7470_005088 [Penicillium chermesinum]|nr:hypothetical protein N7470_005088 [Penicillium chermesinum]
MDPDASIPSEPAPSVFNYVLSFLLVGVAWGFTTPFIRRAAADFNARQEKQGRVLDPPARGRAQPSPGGEDEEQELLLADPHPESEEPEDGVRRRSASRQRQETLTAGGAGGVTGDEDNIPDPAWMRAAPRQSWLKAKVVSVFWTVVNLLRTPAYSVPLVINLTGSIWFFPFGGAAW